MEQFRQRIIASAHLKPLNVEEVKNYINHRLKQANCNKDKLFPEEAFQLIFEKTLGVPRKINIFVDRLLLFGFLEELDTITNEAINEVATEMSVELTGSLDGSELTNEQSAQPLVVNSTENVENIKNVLREVEEILETTIQQKVKMTRYIDKLLKQKNRQFAELQVKDNEN